MKRFEIRGKWSSKKVWINEKELAPERSIKIWNHSPDGFNWGYHGSGPAQLALAILLEVTDNVKYSIDAHMKFKTNFVSNLPQTDFERTILYDLITQQIIIE